MIWWKHLKKAAVWCNVLCHGSWRRPNSDGASVPFFVKKSLKIFDAPVSLNDLEAIQKEASALVFDVMDTVTRMGWQFPGGAGLGRPILS